MIFYICKHWMLNIAKKEPFIKLRMISSCYTSILPHHRVLNYRTSSLWNPTHPLTQNSFPSFPQLKWDENEHLQNCTIFSSFLHCIIWPQIKPINPADLGMLPASQSITFVCGMGVSAGIGAAAFYLGMKYSQYVRVHIPLFCFPPHLYLCEISNS